MAKKDRTPKAERAMRIGVVDTMFARFDMGASARAELEGCPGYGETFAVVSHTVPGFKDLAVAALNLIQKDGCAIVVALGTTIQEAEKVLILRTLEHVGGNKQKAARVLGISRRCLYNRLEEYGVMKPSGEHAHDHEPEGEHDIDEDHAPHEVEA